jgi:predicted RNase H-like nuclease (RuvC/YqgF family)
MQSGLSRLPFDEQNEQDFEDLTQRILGGLATIRKNRSVPATQEKLAKLAGCARKTLHNRGWPIADLKKIKEERKANKNEPKKPTAARKLDEEVHINREKLLVGQIRNYQEQNGKLFERVQDLEEQVASLNTTAKILEDETKSLKEDKRKLESEVRRLKQGQSGKTSVVSISALKTAK